MKVRSILVCVSPLQSAQDPSDYTRPFQMHSLQDTKASKSLCLWTACAFSISVGEEIQSGMQSSIPLNLCVWRIHVRSPLRPYRFAEIDKSCITLQLCARYEDCVMFRQAERSWNKTEIAMTASQSAGEGSGKKVWLWPSEEQIGVA